MKDVQNSREIWFSETTYIKNKTRRISGEKLAFRNGEKLGDLCMGIEDGATIRKVRRIVEKRVNQDIHNTYGHCRRRRHFATHNVSNTMKNIYGEVPCVFKYCCAA